MVIAGSGCAGLSLALRLRRYAPQARLVLVDRDHGGHPHKLWSFWSEAPAAALPCPMPVRCWSRLHVAGPGWSRTSDLGPLAYCTVHSDTFESAAMDVLRVDPNVRFVTGSVRAVESTESEARVLLGDRTLRAPYAFQSCLPPEDAGPRYPIWQHFGGAVVRSERPRFDPTTFTLMNFALPQRDGPTFLYKLPFSRTEALYEHTVFSARRLPREEHRAALLAELGRRGLGGLEIVREEYGAIPMFERRPSQRRGPRAFNLGVVGGMAKPTTGYAFLRIQQQTEHLARTWAAGRPSPLPDPAWRLRAYDTALLDLIHRAPDQATATLQQLLQRADPRAVLRFLDERPSVSDELAILLGALPWGPLLRSAASALRPAQVSLAGRGRESSPGPALSGASG